MLTPDYLLKPNIGTTNSAVAVLEGKTPRIIENAEGQ